MKTLLFIMAGMVLIPIILVSIEFYLCKKSSKMALILPIIVACFFVLLGLYALIMSAILFAIYFIMNHIKKEKLNDSNELNKMNIQDLE